jgi:hypothetical protein
MPSPSAERYDVHPDEVFQFIDPALLAGNASSDGEIMYFRLTPQPGLFILDDGGMGNKLQTLAGKLVAFYCLGDLLGEILVGEVRSPEEQNANLKDGDVPAENWELVCDGTTWRRRYPPHESLAMRRIGFPEIPSSVLEGAFLRTWQNYNKQDSRGFSHFIGLLQFMVKFDIENQPRHAGKQTYVTEREQEIAASVVQFMGSQGGWKFLRQVDKASGGMLKKILGD